MAMSVTCTVTMHLTIRMHCIILNNTVLIMILPVANPDLDQRGEGGGVGLALPAFLPPAIFPFFKQSKGGLPGSLP